MKIKSLLIKIIIFFTILAQLNYIASQEQELESLIENKSNSKVQNGAILWQGFNFKWERNVLEMFEIPHRLGSFESLFSETTTFSSDSKISPKGFLNIL